MDVITLQSGSNGNCIYVESDGIRLLFDAGISGRQAEQRLAESGRSIVDVQGLIVSHDHRDHVSGIGIFQRKFGLPIHITEATMRVASAASRLGKLNDVRYFEAGGTIRFGHVSVQTIRTPHDAVDGVGFVVDDGSRRVGILTDLGHPFAGLDDILKTLDGLVIESNHDPRMLACGRYSPWLRARIEGPGGHLSNDEAAALVRAARSQRLQWVCLGHLSEENNHPEVAAATHRRIAGTQVPLRIASRTGAGEVLCV